MINNGLLKKKIWFISIISISYEKNVQKLSDKLQKKFHTLNAKYPFLIPIKFNKYIGLQRRLSAGH